MDLLKMISFGNEVVIFEKIFFFINTSTFFNQKNFVGILQTLK
jgi:hypothetical protein